MYLRDVLKGVRFKTKDPVSGLDVKRVVCDSREANKGDTFIAFRGYAIDGSKFINDAITNGAKVIITEKDFNAPAGVKKILIDDSRAALPLIAGNFYGHPSQKLKMIGVTGTNGKTTITYIIENILKCAGETAGVIGTINYRVKDKAVPAKNTTPGPIELQSMLAAMAGQGAGFVVMEVSSHSLDQCRVDGLLFDVAIFTNITLDHLDYHKTAENYFKAKAKLFRKLKTGGVAILNNDDKKVVRLKRSMKKVLTYGVKEKADVRPEDLKVSLDGSRFVVKAPNTSFRVDTKLIGEHNVSNILASIAASLAAGIEVDAIIKGVNTAAFAPGRLEPVDEGQAFKVFVDYAHTEDALRNVLGLLKSSAAGSRIITVFGCGGNRDRTKRPLMGSTACEFSDDVVVTSDNPRFEEPSGIIDEIERGIKGKFSNYDVIIDRSEAIGKALRMASRGDIVLIAGKGHEDYQVIKDKVIPFDDREVARKILRKIKNESKRNIKDNARAVVIR